MQYESGKLPLEGLKGQQVGALRDGNHLGKRALIRGVLPMGATRAAVGRRDHEGSLALPGLLALLRLIVLIQIDHVLFHSSIISIMEPAGTCRPIINNY